MNGEVDLISFTSHAVSLVLHVWFLKSSEWIDLRSTKHYDRWLHTYTLLGGRIVTRSQKRRYVLYYNAEI